MHPFAVHYRDTIATELQKQFGHASLYQVPQIERIVVNVGLGDVLANSGTVDQVTDLLTKITGQKPAPTKARKAIAGFKIRKGMVVGARVTLRGQRMYDFLQKLIVVSLPRTRDFRGLNPTSISADGSLHIGIKDSMIFPEVAQENFSHPLQVSLVTTTHVGREEARVLYNSLGFVFQDKH